MMAQGTEGTVPHTRFDTTLLPAKQRLEAWREAISVLFDAQPAEPEAAQAPFVLENWMLGPAVLSIGAGPGFFYERSAQAIARDGLDLIMIQFYEAGQSHIERGAPAVATGTGDLMVTDLACPIVTRETTFRNINLLLPRSSIAPLLRAPDAQGGRVLRGDLPLVTLARRHLQELTRHASHLHQSEAMAVVGATAQLMAAALNGSVNDETVNGARVALACQIRRFIEEHLHGHDLAPEALAVRFGLSRATIYRLFSMEGGIREYVQRRRLVHAREHIISPAGRHTTIAAIGHEAGYAHARDFIRAYRREFGVSPGEDREGARLERRSFLTRRAPKLPVWSEWVRSIR